MEVHKTSSPKENNPNKVVPVFNEKTEGDHAEHSGKYPKHVTFILGNEFLERFSYYGTRSVLFLYLRNYLQWDDDTATSVYHTFTLMAYLFPLLGAIIADSYWGKYKTILILSIVYTVGLTLNTIGSIPYIPTHTAHVAFSMFGLFFLAVGTGGIKPCVSSFGADQFSVNQQVARKQFFSLFYFFINAGGLIGIFLTPVLRADLDCYPNESRPEFKDCFAVAFGVPTIFMMISLGLFIAGTKWYTIYSPEGSIFVRFCHCVYSACKNRWNTPESQRDKDDWVEYADAPPKMIRDTKYVLRVLLLFLPLPFFWALYDQIGSRWTLQAIHTNGYLGSVLIKPDQVEILNPLLVLILIPLFEMTLFPLLRYWKIPFPPLRRMVVGLTLAGISFIIASILQRVIDKSSTLLPKADQFGIRFINSAPCNLVFYPAGSDSVTVMSKEASSIYFYPFDKTKEFQFTDCNGKLTEKLAVSADANQEVIDIVVDRSKSNKVKMITEKPEGGGGRFSLVNMDGENRTLVIWAIPEDGGYLSKMEKTVQPGERSGSIDIHYGNATIKIYSTDSFDNVNNSIPILSTNINIGVGGVYTVVKEKDNRVFQVTDVNPNTVSVVWMIPQYLIISVGEVFLSITGLEFSYSQAPPSMKSVLSSVWLFTVSLGNMIVIVIAGAKGIENQADEFILFASLIFAAALIFSYLAYKYIPVDEREFVSELSKDKKRQGEKSLFPRKKKKKNKIGGGSFVNMENSENFTTSSWETQTTPPVAFDGDAKDTNFQTTATGTSNWEGQSFPPLTTDNDNKDLNLQSNSWEGNTPEDLAMEKDATNTNLQNED